MGGDEAPLLLRRRSGEDLPEEEVAEGFSDVVDVLRLPEEDGLPVLVGGLEDEKGVVVAAGDIEAELNGEELRCVRGAGDADFQVVWPGRCRRAGWGRNSRRLAGLSVAGGWRGGGWRDGFRGIAELRVALERQARTEIAAGAESVFELLGERAGTGGEALIHIGDFDVVELVAEVGDCCGFLDGGGRVSKSAARRAVCSGEEGDEGGKKGAHAGDSIARRVDCR